MRKFFALLLVFGLVFALIGCTDKASLTVNETDKTITLTVGDTKTVIPTVVGDKKIVWESSNLSVAIVSQTGVITAVEAGTVTITVSLEGTELKQEITVTISRPDPTSVNIIGEGDILIGETLELTGTVSPAKASQTLTWTSSDNQIATVDNNGKVTGVAAGEVTITATSVKSSVKGEVTVKVVRPNPTSVTITGPKEVPYGGSIDLTATVNPDLAAQGVIWSVDKPEFATIDPATGKLTAVKGGTVVVTAAAAAKVSVFGTYTVQVLFLDPTQVTISGPAEVAMDETGTFTAVVEPVGASPVVTWTVSDTAKATIDATGKLTPVAVGTVKVIATSTLETIKAEVDVVIAPERVHASLELDGAYWPITGTDAFISGDPVKTFTTKAGLNPTAAEYYVAGDASNHLNHIFIQDANYKIAPSVWQARAFLNRNESGFYEIEVVLQDGSAYVNPTLTDYEYVLYAHSGYANGYNFIKGLEVGQVITLNGFDITSQNEFSIGEIDIKVYTNEQGSKPGALIGRGGEELVLPIPGKLGYVFEGWFTSSDFTGTPVTGITESTKVYAKWGYDYSHILVRAEAPTDEVYLSTAFNRYFVKGKTAFTTLADALAAVSENGTIYIEAGSYVSETALAINKKGLTLVGVEGSVINNKITVAANLDGLTIKNLKFTGKSQFEFAVAGGMKNFTFENNTVTDMATEAVPFIYFKNDGTADFENFVIKGNKFLVSETGKSVRWIRGGNVKNFTATNNIFEGKSTVSVDAIRLEGNNDAASAGNGAGGVVTITNNQFNKLGQNGVRLIRVSATKVDITGNLFDQNGNETSGGAIDIINLVPETVLEVNILKNTIQNNTHNYGIRLGTESVPTLGKVNIKENKFINFTAGVNYVTAYSGVQTLDVNNNFYQVAPTAATMKNVPVDAYAESYTVLKVQFDSQSGSAVADFDVPVALERKATKPTDPTREGYTFVGWFKEAAGTNAFDFNSTIDFPVKVYAKWTAIEYNVNYHADGGEFGLAFANKNEMIPVFMEDLYKFINPTESKSDFFHGEGKTSGWDGLWHSKEEYKNKIYAGPRPEAPNEAYFISHPDYMEKWLPFFDNMQAFVKAVNNTQNFYNDTFVGFIRIRQYIINTKPASYVTDAQMAMFPDQYKLTVKFTIEDEFPLVAPTKEGRMFMGWYDNSEFNGTPVTKVDKGTKEDLHFYAKWAYSNTITYKNVDDTLIAVQPITMGSVLLQPADPKRTGYNFVAWYTDAEFKNEYEFGKKITEDLTLYAKWEEIEYTLTFELNGGDWGWTTGTVEVPENNKPRVDSISTLPTILMQDIYQYLKTNNLLTSDKVTTELQKTNWVDFSKSYTDPYAIYNWTSATSTSYKNTTGYNQFFFDTAAGNDETFELTEIVGGFFGTEPYKTKYANLIYHLALLTGEKYKGDNTTLWTEANGKGAAAFVLDGYFYGTQNLNNSSDNFKALRVAIPTPTNKYVFEEGVLKSVETVYQAMKKMFTKEVQLVAPSRVGYVFEGWYTTADFTSAKLDKIAANAVPAAKYYAKWKNVQYDEIDVTLELNGGLSGTRLVAGYYNATDWSGKSIVLKKSSVGGAWYQMALKSTADAGYYEVIGKGTGYTNADANFYLAYHDSIDSPFKATIMQTYSGLKVGDKFFIPTLPTSTGAGKNVEILYKPSTAKITAKLSTPGDFPVVFAPAGKVLEGWYTNAEFTGDKCTSYPGFEGINLGPVTYYAKWVKEALASFDFGTAAVTGYAAGELTLTGTGAITSLTAPKDRVQINISTFAPHDTKGAFLVLAPVKDILVSYIDFNFSTLTDLKEIELEYSVWKAATKTNIAGLTSANLKLQKKDGDNWVDVKVVDIKATADDTKYIPVTFEVTGAGTYRLTYVIEGATKTSNVDYALTVDSMKLYK